MVVWNFGYCFRSQHCFWTETSIVATGNDFFVFLQVSIALNFFTSPLPLLRPLCMRVPTNSSLVLCCDQTSMCPANVCNLRHVPEWSMWIKWFKINKKHVLFTAVADFCDPGQRVFWFCFPSNLLTALLRGVERVHVSSRAAATSSTSISKQLPNPGCQALLPLPGAVSHIQKWNTKIILTVKECFSLFE